MEVDEIPIEHVEHLNKMLEQEENITSIVDITSIIGRFYSAFEHFILQI